MREDRIAKLSERFKSHVAGRKPTSTRSRAKHSLYLDADLVSRLDTTYRDVDHDLHPAHINKSAFLEALIEYGLENIAEVKSMLRRAVDEESA